MFNQSKDVKGLVVGLIIVSLCFVGLELSYANGLGEEYMQKRSSVMPAQGEGFKPIELVVPIPGIIAPTDPVPPVSGGEKGEVPHEPVVMPLPGIIRPTDPVPPHPIKDGEKKSKPITRPVAETGQVYDESGNIIGSWTKQYEYDQYGRVKKVTIITYDAQGNRSLSTEEYTYKGNNWTCTYRDENGKIVKTREQTHRKDKDGKIIAMTAVEKDAQGNVLRRVEALYEYNAQGQRISGTATVFNGNGEKIGTSKNTYKYDANGKLSQIISEGYDAQGNLTLKTTLNYQDGRKIDSETIRYNKDGTTTTTKSKYEYDPRTRIHSS